MLTVLLSLLAPSLSSDEQGQSQPNTPLTPLQFAQGSQAVTLAAEQLDLDS